MPNRLIFLHVHPVAPSLSHPRCVFILFSHPPSSHRSVPHLAIVTTSTTLPRDLVTAYYRNTTRRHKGTWQRSLRLAHNSGEEWVEVMRLTDEAKHDAHFMADARWSNIRAL